jgi:hypothetical protein
VPLNLPESWTERLPFLEAFEEDWQPVSRAVLIVASVFYGIFLLQAGQGTGLRALIDLVFIPVHEGGHLLFRFFGMFIMVAGGTIMQLAVPLMLATWFALHRQVPGTAFCTFFFFEQMLPISTYMADARAQELPLLTVGDADYAIHDWAYLFGRLGVLNYDVQIAEAVRALGWCGMLATVGWMVWRSLNSPQTSSEPLAQMPLASKPAAQDDAAGPQEPAPDKYNKYNYIPPTR